MIISGRAEEKEKMNFDNRILKLKTKTWSRDSYGLFDFETNNYFSHNLNIRSPGLIVRDGNEIHFVPETSKLASKTIGNSNPLEILAVIAVEDGIFLSEF